ECPRTHRAVADGGHGISHGCGAAVISERHQSRGAESACAICPASQQGGGAMNPAIPHAVEYIRILPELVLSAFGIIIMLLDPLLEPRRSQKTLATIALVGSIVAILATLWQARYPGTGFWNMARVDSFSVFFHFLVT